MSNQASRFFLYRYQILPLYRAGVREDAENGIFSLDTLLEKKNFFFKKSLNLILSGEKLGGERVKVVKEIEDSHLLKIAPRRNVEIENENFEKKKSENWPSVYMFIWNDPQMQIVAVEERFCSYQLPDTPIKKLLKVLLKEMKNYQLTVQLEEIRTVSDFWENVSKYKGKVKEISFKIITPNMSNISRALSDEFKALAKDSNAELMKLSLKSEKDSALEIEKENENLSCIANYTAKGGGSTKIKVGAFRRSISVDGGIRSVELDNLEIQGNNPDAVISKLKELLKDL